MKYKFYAHPKSYRLNDGNVARHIVKANNKNKVVKIYVFDHPHSVKLDRMWLKPLRGDASAFIEHFEEYKEVSLDDLVLELI